MTARTALVVTFDQLPASILGCYGNEWVETPNLDRLAADGFAADQCWSAHAGPASAETAFRAESCIAALASRPVQTAVILEDASQTIFPLAGVRRVVVSGEHGSEAKPDRIPLAELVRAAQAAISDSPSPSLVWLHARGLEIPAAPPPGFAELYQDEFEDRGVRFEALSDAERAAHPIAAAGMVSLFDHWLGELFAAVRSSDRPALALVTAAAGARWQPWPNSFGELDALRSQMIHVPFIAQTRGAEDRTIPSSGRSSQLVSPTLLSPLLEWWFADSGDSWSDWLTKHAAETIVTPSADGSRRITTHDWAALFPPAGAASQPLLFRKPEDYWEVNNQAAVLPETVDELQRALPSSERGASAP